MEGLKRRAGTKADPTIIYSQFDRRIVGCLCKYNYVSLCNLTMNPHLWLPSILTRAICSNITTYTISIELVKGITNELQESGAEKLHFDVVTSN